MDIQGETVDLQDTFAVVRSSPLAADFIDAIPDHPRANSATELLTLQHSDFEEPPANQTTSPGSTVIISHAI